MGVRYMVRSFSDILSDIHFDSWVHWASQSMDQWDLLPIWGNSDPHPSVEVRSHAGMHLRGVNGMNGL